MDCWSELGIEETTDCRLIRRAYARQVKHRRPEDDPRGFEQLRVAYELAMNIAAGSSADPGLPDPISCTDSPGPESGAPAEPPGVLEPQADVETVAPHVAEAESLLESIERQLISAGDEVAAETLVAAADTDVLTHLASRSMVENSLVAVAARTEPIPLKLLDTCAQLFGWDDGIEHLHYREEADRLYARVVARRRFIYLKNLARDPYNRPGKPPGPLLTSPVLGALLGPYEPWRFRSIVFWGGSPEIYTAMKWLTHFEIDFPEILQYEMEPRTAEWWQRAAVVPRPYFADIILGAFIGAIIMVLSPENRLAAFVLGTTSLTALFFLLRVLGSWIIASRRRARLAALREELARYFEQL